MQVKKIKKRSGEIVDFKKEKIAYAIFKAVKAVGGQDKKNCEKLAEKVVEYLEKELKKEMPTVEEVQDAVEKILIEEGHAKTAKAYILYRQQRAEMRKEKARVLEKEDTDEVDKKFDINALKVLKSRYLEKDDAGKTIETPKQLFTRVAVHTSLPNLFYDERFFVMDGSAKIHPHEDFKPSDHNNKYSIGKYKLNQFHMDGIKRMYDRHNKQGKINITWNQFLDHLKKGDFNEHEKDIDNFFEIMTHRKFMPNTPAIANFGAHLGMGSACFVLDVQDSMEGIMDTLKATAIIHKAGGGTGFNFSKLRPEGDFIKTTKGVSSGPLTFMKLFDTMTDVVKQGGIRRGANMGIMNSSHPDIEKFITAKDGNKALRNFNISVLMMPEFWDCYNNDKPYPLRNPRNNEIVRTVDPKRLFDMIVYQAWSSAEPGVIFFDKVNEHNPFLDHLGPIVTTNPCVSADSLVSTENGLERIDSMKSENITVDIRTVSQTSDLLYSQIGCKNVKITNRIKTGYKDCYKIETKSGYEVTATPDHRILTAKGWKQVEDITEEDFILIQSGEGNFSKDKKLPFDVKNEIIGENGRLYKLNLPTAWSRELGILLGWMTGDGFINYEHNQIGLVFAEGDIEARKIIQPIFEKYCNREIKEVKYPNGCIQLRSSSKYVIEFFKNLGVKKEREVPSSVFTATEEAVIGYLEGLFSSDGTIAMGSKSRNYVRLNSSFIKLLKQVQQILLNMGIKTSIYDRSTKSKTFRYVNKKGELIKYKTSGENYELNISKMNATRFIQKISFMQNRNKEKLEELKKFEFYKERFTDKVKSKEFVGKKEVWDITEPQTHSFIANGVVVHNCGEVLLYPNEPCNLGSINVWAFVKEDDESRVYVDWDSLKETVRTATRFLDNVIDVNKWPLPEIEEMALNTRKIGLGIMGLGDLLFELGLPYNTEKSRDFMEELMEFVNYYSKVESIELARTRGSMPYYEKSFFTKGRMPFAGFYDKDSWHFDWDKISKDSEEIGMRNGFTTVIAPTGSISMISGCSSGIEPVYSLVYEKNVKVGSFYYVNPVFEKAMKRLGIFDDSLMEDVLSNKSSIRNISYIPPKVKETFVTAMDIKPEDHIRALAAFQKWVDSSISKTNNFPADATVEDMRKSYILAYELGCKDVTVFRDSSIKDQVLVAGTKESEQRVSEAHKAYEEQREKERLKVEKHHAPVKSNEMVEQISYVDGGVTVPIHEESVEYTEENNEKLCPSCSIKLNFKEGCASCPECGWGICSA